MILVPTYFDIGVPAYFDIRVPRNSAEFILGPIIRNIAIMGPLFRNMLKTAKTGAGRTYFMALVRFNTRCRHAKHRKWEPEGVHGQLEGCNRNLRPKAAVAKVYTHGNKHLLSKGVLNKIIK